MRRKLAEEERHGDVSVCGRCQDVHIRWGELMLSLDTDRFESFARMVAEARAALVRSGTLPAPMSAPEALVQ